MKLKVTTIKADVPTVNGRVYTDECLQQMTLKIKDKINQGRMLVQLKNEQNIYNPVIEYSKVCGIAENIDYIDGQLNIEVSPTNTVSGHILKELFNSDNVEVSLDLHTMAHINFKENIPYVSVVDVFSLILV